MKILLNQFIQFYKFFTQLEETDKEELNKEMNVFVERLKELDFDSMDNQDLVVSMLIGDMEGKYTNFGRLYNHFIQIMDSINEAGKKNMNLINPDNLDNFTFHLKNFINLMYELNEFDNIKVKELIEIQNRNNPDKEYVNKIRNNLDRFIPVVSNSLDEIVNDELSKEIVYDIRDKYIISSELAEIINVERSAIDYHIKRKEFPNMKQKGKGFKIEIPFKDIDKFCLKHSKYSKLWDEYKKNL